jgi:dihydrofolate synthase/folylpolyglutamate synthase
LDYQTALGYLYGLTDYEKERIVRYDPETLNLSRVQRVLARLGDPQQRFASVHVAGTKGKGSVAAMIASVLRSAGLRTGLYTSPHLHSFRERIQVNGEPIAPETMTALVEGCRPMFDAEPGLTTFEAATALTFTYFARRGLDFAVVEVGLGGRLDATNVITPQVAVITSLSFDHTYLLGDTLADIAREKAGIIKPGVPTVCAPQEAEALDVIQKVCVERRAPLTLVGRDWTWQALPSLPAHAVMKELSPGLNGQSFELTSAQNNSALQGRHTISLLGRHQLNNAAVAIATLDLLARGGVPLHPHHLRQGLADVQWPGRFEILRQAPPLVVDCAHNADSVSKLVAALEEWFPGRRWTFILGASSDKDVPGMLRALAPRIDHLLTTQSRHARAMPSQKLAELAQEALPSAGAPLARVTATSDVASALDLALRGDEAQHSSLSDLSFTEQRQAICVTGSIFAVADAREAWARYTGRPLPETDDPMGQAELVPGQDEVVQAQARIR